MIKLNEVKKAYKDNINNKSILIRNQMFNEYWEFVRANKFSWRDSRIKICTYFDSGHRWKHSIRRFDKFIDFHVSFHRGPYYTRSSDDGPSYMIVRWETPRDYKAQPGVDIGAGVTVGVAVKWPMFSDVIKLITAVDNHYFYRNKFYYFINENAGWTGYAYKCMIGWLEFNSDGAVVIRERIQ